MTNDYNIGTNKKRWIKLGKQWTHSTNRLLTF